MFNKRHLKKVAEMFLDDMIDNGASSASIMVYNKGDLGYYLSTCDKWQDFYSDAKESQHCHIAQLGVKLAKEKKSFSIVWDTLTPENDESKYLNEQREKFDHCHGISICESLPNDTLLGIILTGRRADINFSQLVIKNKQSISDKLIQLKQIGSLLAFE